MVILFLGSWENISSVSVAISKEIAWSFFKIKVSKKIAKKLLQKIQTIQKIALKFKILMQL
jgi:hypothetical protein